MDACRILERLQQAELSEPEIWFRQDYRQAYMCVSLAERGELQPFIESSYRIYGTHPDLVWHKIMENRKAKLGKEFLDWYDEAGNSKPDLPKKKPAIYIDEQAERATNERLAALLDFPKWVAQRADMLGADGARKQKSGTLYEMPKPAEHQPLRILPA
jgi:hypothetical protein